MLPEIRDVNAIIADIKNNDANLRLSDKNLAYGIIETLKRTKRPASDKQMYHLRRIAAAALAPAPAPQTREKHEIGDLSGVVALFDKAKEHLKRPKVVIDVAGKSLRLTLAAEGTRVPGSINVASGDDWFGRILRDGHFEASPRVPTPAGLVDGLRAFAADPAGVASEHGRRTGNCCFCNTKITTKESLSVGYGPICADRFGLPWGDTSKFVPRQKYHLRASRMQAAVGE